MTFYLSRLSTHQLVKIAYIPTVVLQIAKLETPVDFSVPVTLCHILRPNRHNAFAHLLTLFATASAVHSAYVAPKHLTPTLNVN